MNVLLFFFHTFGVTVVVAFNPLRNFVQEIGAALAEIDPFAHALCLTAVFINSNSVCITCQKLYYRCNLYNLKIANCDCCAPLSLNKTYSCSPKCNFLLVKKKK